MEKRRSFFKSLRGKVSLQMLIVSLLPVILVGLLAYNSMKTAEDKTSESVGVSRAALEQDTVGANKAGLAWLLSYDMEKQIAERIKDVDNWAGKAAVVNAARSSSDDDSEAYKYLGEEISGTTYFDYAYLVDLSDNVVTQVVTGNNRPDKESISPSVKLAEENRVYVSDITLGAGIEPSYIMEIAVRVDDLNADEAVGVVVGVVKIHPLSLAQEYEKKVTGNRVVVWNRNGTLITDSEEKKRYNMPEITWSEAEQELLDRITDDVEVIMPGYVITDDVVAGYARAANESIDINYPEFGGLGWTVMVEQGADVAFASLDSLQDLEDDLEENTNSTIIILVIVLIVVFAVVLGMSFYLSRGITRPIAQLSDAAEKVSMGELDVNVDVKSDDEIGDLAASFGRMVTAVKFLSEDED